MSVLPVRVIAETMDMTSFLIISFVNLKIAVEKVFPAFKTSSSFIKFSISLTVQLSLRGRCYMSTIYEYGFVNFFFSRKNFFSSFSLFFSLRMLAS